MPLASTDSERLAAELRASELRFRRFVDHAADSFFLSVHGGRFVDVNAAACSTLGYTREELLQLTVLDVQEGIDEQGLDGLWDAIRPGEPMTVETTSRRKDGSCFPVEVRVARLDSEGERLMLALVRDVTARKDAVAELARRAERQAAIADLGRRALAGGELNALLDEAVHTVQATLDVDMSSVLELEPDGERLVARATAGWPESLVGNATVSPNATHAGCTLEHDGAVVVADLRTDGRFGESALLHEHGVVSGMSSVIEGRGQAYGVLCAHTTSPRSFSDDDVNFLQAVANVLAAAVTREREEVLQAHAERSRRVEAVGQLAGGIAHDFNNLLAIILNYTQFAIDASGDRPELCEDLQEIDQAAQRASELTRELLVFSGQEALETDVIDVNALIRENEGMLRRALPRDVSLDASLGEGLWPTRAAPGQLEQVLVQLAVNAAEAMPSGGVVALSTDNLALDEQPDTRPEDMPAGRFVRVTVADTGPGMSDDLAAHAFDLFFTTKESGGGSGLGLAIVHGIARQLGGFARLYSEDGIGTAVKVYLPAVEGCEDAPDLQDGADLESRGETVLLVEDHEALRLLTRRILSEHGYAVVEAPGAEEALRAWDERSGAVDLLLTDVMMPGESGAALAETLRARCPDLAVLFMSGFPGGMLARDGSLDGAVVVEKPFSSVGLLRGVRQALGGDS